MSFIIRETADLIKIDYGRIYIIKLSFGPPALPFFGPVHAIVRVPRSRAPSDVSGAAARSSPPRADLTAPLLSLGGALFRKPFSRSLRRTVWPSVSGPGPFDPPRRPAFPEGRPGPVRCSGREGRPETPFRTGNFVVRVRGEPERFGTSPSRPVGRPGYEPARSIVRFRGIAPGRPGGAYFALRFSSVLDPAVKPGGPGFRVWSRGG